MNRPLKAGANYSIVDKITGLNKTLWSIFRTNQKTTHPGHTLAQSRVSECKHCLPHHTTTATSPLKRLLSHSTIATCKGLLN